MANYVLVQYLPGPARIPSKRISASDGCPVARTLRVRIALTTAEVVATATAGTEKAT